MQNEQRELWADYAKGLGILLVYIGHLGALPQIIRVFIYLFHMPVFFFCMGYYINISLDCKTFVKKRALQLLVPFYFSNILYLLWRIFKQLVFSHEFHWGMIVNYLLGILYNNRTSIFPSYNWFIIASFVTCVYYYLLRHYVNRIKIELFFVVGISILFTYLSYFFKFALPWYLDVAFPCLLFVYLGAFVKKNKAVFGKKIMFITGFVGIAFSVFVYRILAQDHTTFLVDYHMLRLFPYSLVTIGGISLCLFVYAVFKRFDKKSFLTYIGENSLIYYLFGSYPITLVNKVLLHFNVTGEFVCACAGLLGIIVFTPFIVMFIKYFFWFLFGKKKESWSFDYSKLILKR